MGGKVLIVLLLVGLARQGADAAVRVDVETRVQERLQFLNSELGKREFPNAVNDVKRVLDLREDESVEEVYAAHNVHGDTNTKFQQKYKGIPVFNAQIVLSRDDKTGEVGKDAYGHFIQKIDEDVKSTTAEIDEDAALLRVKTMAGDTTIKSTVTNAQVKKYIYIDEEPIKAYLAYHVSYTAVGSGKLKRPTYMIDANEGTVFFDYNNIPSYLVGGVGGNVKMGKYRFGETPKLGKLDVVKNSDGKCELRNKDILVIDMKQTKAIPNLLKPYTYDCNTDIKDEINEGYSPLTDAMYFGAKAFAMFREWANIEMLKYRPVPMLIHYDKELDNAFWDGTHAYFGDGATQFYPQATFDIIAHEMGHGFTGQRSGLIYSKMSGGMNEAFSDMTGEAFELYLDFKKVDWKFDYYSTKGSGTLRWFETPSKDGGSIDVASQYDAEQGPHTTSGVYRKAFYHLATKTGWGIKKAWLVAVRANAIYWKAASTFNEGACGMERAAENLGFNKADVTDAFRIVEVSCSGKIESNVKELKVGVPLTGLSGQAGTETFYQVKLTSLETKLRLSTSGGSGDLKLYVRKGNKPSLSEYDKLSAMEGNTESITIDNAQAGAYFILLFASQTFSGVTLRADLGTIPATTQAPPAGTKSLQSGEEVMITGSEGSSKHFKIMVTQGTDQLLVTLSGGSGDADLLVREGQAATESEFDKRSNDAGSNEKVDIIAPKNAEYYILVHGYAAYKDVKLKAVARTNAHELSNGVEWNVPDTPAGKHLNVRIKIPTAATPQTLRIQTYGGSGDADLYARYNAKASHDNYDKASLDAGTIESITFDPAKPGYYYVRISAISAFNGVKIKASYGSKQATTPRTTVPTTSQKPTDSSTTLTLGVPKTDIAIPKDEGKQFTITLTTAMSKFTILTTTSEGDADLYVEKGSLATESSSTKSDDAGNEERLEIANPGTGTFHILVKAYAAVKGLNIVVKGPPAVPSLTSGVLQTGLAGKQNTKVYYKIDVPAGQDSLVIKATGSVGDCDLFVAIGEKPNEDKIEDGYSSQSATANEKVAIASPKQGAYFIMLKAYSDYNALSLVATYSKIQRLQSGKAITIATLQESVIYAFEASGKGDVIITTSGGTGDADVVAKYGGVPSDISGELSSDSYGNDERVTISNPQTGTYMIMVKAVEAATNIKLEVTQVSSSKKAVNRTLSRLIRLLAGSSVRK